MEYINVVLNFLNDYCLYVLPAIAALLFLFGIVNWASNVYRRQNKKIAYCSRIIASYPDKVGLYANLLPETYRRQWRAFVNSGAEKPSSVFEFVPLRGKIHLVCLIVIVAVASSLYVAVFALTNAQIGYILYQVAFWLAFGLIMVANKAINRKNERYAKQIFGKLVSLLNSAASLPKSDDAIIEETVAKLNNLKKNGVTDVVIGEASALLRGKGLDCNRSVEQQRKLNTALNGLLQAYARNAPKIG
ncbi:MAG: hypothetical protein J1F66_00810 [Clostridiales bacterium]|nr:hypothetical protein [Clostridiales bacterium]